MREPTRSSRDDGRSAWVEALLELGVQLDQSHDSPPHRDERHDLGARVEAAPRQCLADELEHRVPQGLGAFARDPEEVLVELLLSELGVRLVKGEERRLAAVDPAGAANDEGARRLAVDRGQVDARRRVALDQVGEHAARADRRQLVGVADEQDVAVAGGAEQRVGELEREHRRLVDDHELDIVRERIVLVAQEPVLVRRVAERAVDRQRVVAGQVAHPPRRLPGRRTEQDADAARARASSTTTRCVCVLPAPGAR